VAPPRSKCCSEVGPFATVHDRLPRSHHFRVAIVIQKSTFKTCDETKCPLPEGERKTSVTQAIPAIAPAVSRRRSSVSTGVYADGSATFSTTV
jgi:hypothetical protein